MISANMTNYYRMRRTETFKGYVDADTKAEVIAFKALQEMREREDSQISKAEKAEQGGSGLCLGYTRVEDALPPRAGRYLCIWKGVDYPEYPDGIEDVLNFSGEYFHFEKVFSPGKVKVTHWMELPDRNTACK